MDDERLRHSSRQSIRDDAGDWRVERIVKVLRAKERGEVRHLRARGWLRAACGTDLTGSSARKLTRQCINVTCKRCLRSKAYKEALDA